MALEALARAAPEHEAVVGVVLVAAARACLVAGRRRLDLQMLRHAARILAHDGRPRVVLHERGGVELVAGDIADAITRAGERNHIAVFGGIHEHLAGDVFARRAVRVRKFHRRARHGVARFLHRDDARAQAHVEHAFAFARLLDEAVEHRARGLRLVAAFELVGIAVVGDERILIERLVMGDHALVKLAVEAALAHGELHPHRVLVHRRHARRSSSARRSSPSPPAAARARPSAPPAPPPPSRPCPRRRR